MLPSAPLSPLGRWAGPELDHGACAADGLDGLVRPRMDAVGGARVVWAGGDGLH